MCLSYFTSIAATHDAFRTLLIHMALEVGAHRMSVESIAERGAAYRATVAGPTKNQINVGPVGLRTVAMLLVISS